MTPLELVLEAADFAAMAHAQQRRKTGHEPYVNHVVRVAREASRQGLSPEVIAAAFLHDVVEDTRYGLDDVRARFPARVVELVHLMTQWWPDDAPEAVKTSEKPKYYAAILRDADAICLKLLDRADNLADMAGTVERARGWAERYLRRTEEEMAPLLEAVTHPGVRDRYERAVATLRAALG
jgi:GTP pyrophosphokinase